MAVAFALCFNARYAEAEPHLRRADELFRASTAPFLDRCKRDGYQQHSAGWVVTTRRTRISRRRLIARVPRARWGRFPICSRESAWQALHVGRWNEADANASEAFELAEQLGQPVTAAQALGVITWVHALRGNEAGLREFGDETRRRAQALGFRLYELLVSLCQAVFGLGVGRVDEAIGYLEEFARHANERGLYVAGLSPELELAEAYIRAGRSTDAEAVLASFESRSSPQFLSSLRSRNAVVACWRTQIEWTRTS